MDVLYLLSYVGTPRSILLPELGENTSTVHK